MEPWESNFGDSLMALDAYNSIVNRSAQGITVTALHEIVLLPEGVRQVGAKVP